MRRTRQNSDRLLLAITALTQSWVMSTRLRSRERRSASLLNLGAHLSTAFHREENLRRRLLIAL